MFNTLFVMTVAVKPTFAAFLCSTRKHMFVASRAILSNVSKNNALKTTHNAFRDCRVHFFRQPFSKYENLVYQRS